MWCLDAFPMGLLGLLQRPPTVQNHAYQGTFTPAQLYPDTAYTCVSVAMLHQFVYSRHVHVFVNVLVQPYHAQAHLL